MRDLNHPKVKPFTREIAAAMAIDPTFIDFVFAKARPECFRYWVEDVERGWTCYVPDDLDAAFPLWCTNADQTLVLAKGDAISFGKGWHDNPDVEMISQTTQGLLAHLLAEVAGAGESDDTLKLAADFCGYRFLNDLLKVMDNAPDAFWDEALRQLIADIDAKCR